MATLPELYLRFTFDLVAHDVFDHLHWGLFRGVPKRPDGLADAQRVYAEHLLTKLPRGVERVIDVGCGLGGLSRMLAAGGKRVRAVSPRQDHCDRLRDADVPGLEVTCARLQDLAVAEPAEVALFAESFNFFVEQDPTRASRTVAAFARLVRPHLVPGGHVLLADILTPEIAEALRTDESFEVIDEEDVHDDVAYTARALQQIFERGPVPYHRLLLDVVEHEAPRLAEELRDLLASVPNEPLRALFAGRMVELDQAEQRRYLMMLLRLCD